MEKTLDPVDAVVVLDELVLPADRGDEWRRLWREHYLPGAQRRGLHLRGLWQGWTEDPDEVRVVVCWSIPRVSTYWKARWAAAGDASVEEFWRRTDEMAVSRNRSSLQNLPTAPVQVSP